MNARLQRGGTRCFQVTTVVEAVINDGVKLTYRCQETPSGIPSFEFKYAEIRFEAYYSLINFRKAATDSAPFLWTCDWDGDVEVSQLRLILFYGM